MNRKVALYILLISICLPSCVTSYTTPIGTWQYAPALFSTEDSPLEGTKVKLSCGYSTPTGSNADWENVHSSRTCPEVANMLEQYKVKIIGEYSQAQNAELKEYDFELTLIDRGNQHLGATSSFLCTISYTLYPCITKVSSELEFLFTDRHKNTVSRKSIKTQITEVFGFNALLFMATSSLSKVDHYKRKTLPQSLATYIINLVQSVNYQVKHKQQPRVST